MSSEITKETIRLLTDFVERNSHIAGIQWNPRLLPRLLVKPFSKDYDEKKKAAHFFLFVAAVNETRLIERRNMQGLCLFICTQYFETDSLRQLILASSKTK